MHSQAVDKKVLPRPRANNSQQSRGGILLSWLRRVRPRACRGEYGGKGGARQRPEARDIAKMKRNGKGWRELMEKRRGANDFITCQRIGLADGERAPDAIVYQTRRVVTGPLHWMGQLARTQITTQIKYTEEKIQTTTTRVSR
jgi:hypothetical protein